jgi:hypothetical protein
MFKLIEVDMSTALTKDEFVRDVSELVVKYFGSIENFARAYNDMLEKDIQAEEDEYEQYDKQHGSFFDRGSADSYYGRPRDPHCGGVGGMSGPRQEAKSKYDFEAYEAGYMWNEKFGGKKEW